MRSLQRPISALRNSYESISNNCLRVNCRFAPRFLACHAQARCKRISTGKPSFATTTAPPDVLKCREVEKPTAEDNEVLIKVRAAAVNPLDLYLMRREPYLGRLQFGLRDAQVGRDVAGQVEAVGRNVTQFKPGDEVFGGCRGAFADYACARENKLALKPANITFEQAAAAPVAGLTA